MTSNRSRAALIDFIALTQRLSELPQTPELLSALDIIKGFKAPPPVLPVRSIRYDDVCEMFDLTRNVEDIWTLQQHDLYNPSSIMTDILDEFQFVVKRSTKNEAYARCLLKNILICCVAEEKRVARLTVQKNSSTAASIDPTRPSTPTPEPAELCLRFETALKYQVNYKKEPRTLSGIADCTLWYNDKESMGTNLVVAEAKPYQSLSEAAEQMVAYMAMIHATRRKEGKRNSVVYGISSEGDGFQFWRIDNESVVTRSITFEWELPYQRQHITSFIRYIIRAAIASSPTTTPVKGQQNREVTMSFFNSPDKGKEFDYGIGHLGADDDDHDGMDLFDLSRY